jgi:S1-C subfamily serine protease
MVKRLLAVVFLLFVAAPDSAEAIFTSKSILNPTQVPVPMKTDGTAHTVESVQAIIEGTAKETGWTTELRQDGSLIAKIAVRNKHFAEVGISFSATNYSISYISSRNLEYNERRQKIHRAYNNWVNNLSERIKKNLRVDRKFTKTVSSGQSASGQSASGQSASGQSASGQSASASRPPSSWTSSSASSSASSAASSSVLRVQTPSPASESEAIKRYFAGRELDLIEGIWTWEDNTYQVAIVQNVTGLEPDYDYVGLVIRAESGSWRPGDVKLLFNSTATPTVLTGVYFDASRRRNNLSFVVEDANFIKVNRTVEGRAQLLLRDYPGKRTQRVSDGGFATSAGTCFVVGPNGMVVTSNHVIENAREIRVTLDDGREATATMEVASAATDLAVLNLDVATPDYLSLASTRSTQAGEQVFTVGFPTVNLLGAEAKFTEGSISALSGIRGEASYMQISVPVQPGNSGGPIVNYSGEVLGVVAATAAVEGFYKDTGSLPQNVNWAVKSDFVRPMIDDVPRRSRSTSRASAIERAQKAVCRVSVTY